MSSKPGRVWAERLGLVLASLIVSLLFAEVAYRMVLGSDTAGRKLRKPSLYADPFSDDLFWLLRHHWQGKQGLARKRPSHPRINAANSPALAVYNQNLNPFLNTSRVLLLCVDDKLRQS